MTSLAPMFELYRFGVFELDLRNHELRKSGVRMRLEDKPLQILELLLRRPGEIVPRQQIQQKLWPDTFVMFDYNVNTAVNKLRTALGDSAKSPRYIETVARRGYRFIAGVESPKRFTAARGAMEALTSMAVLPFRNTGGHADTEYLSDGLSEAVIRHISQISGLRVMAWSTVLRYKGREIDPRTLGQDLRVRSVLVGRVTTGENGLSLSAELVDAETGWRLWGEEYSRGRNEIQTLPGQIARDIAAEVQPGDASAGRGPHGGLYSRNAEAYAEYLKGRYHWHKLSGHALHKSVAHFELAIENDPNFALAHSALAEAYVLFAFSALLPPRDAMEKARAAALRALEIDGTLAEAHAACASVAKLYEWDWAKAETEYLRCLDLDPNSATARRGYASYLSAVGRPAEALVQIQKAHELDPLSLIIGIDMAWNLYMARQHEQAVRQATRVMEMEPEFPATNHVLGLALEALGRHDEAISFFRKVAERTEPHQSAIACLAHSYARCGRTEDARALIDHLTAESRTRYVAPYLFAVIHSGLGDADEAIRWLEHGLEGHDVWMVWVNRDPRFDPIRGTAGFLRLLARMNFPA